jgi:hypothetical protein
MTSETIQAKRGTVFLNWDGPQGKETVDEFTRKAGQTFREFSGYVRDMVSEYHLAGMAVYRSSRACKGWSE